VKNDQKSPIFLVMPHTQEVQATR